MYARKLTKEELLEYGINEVTTTGKVFRHGKEVKPTIDKQGYFMFRIYAKDENDNKIKIPKKNTTRKSQYSYKTRAIGLHRLMWAWHYGEVPAGMVVDHKNNRHDRIEDYYLDNLQLKTPGENLAKERDNWHKWEIKCNLHKPRSHFEDKLAKYEALYEKAKADHDAEAAHKYRSNISQVRARIRYYDNHIEEAKALQAIREEKEAKKKAYHEAATKKKELKAKIDSAHKYYKEVRAAYGKDDEYAKKLWGEWKLAIAEYYGYCSENKSEA